MTNLPTSKNDQMRRFLQSKNRSSDLRKSRQLTRAYGSLRCTHSDTKMFREVNEC